jgi:predicted Zn-dependent protease
MTTLEPPDAFYFSAAVGWLELGDPHEARTELSHLSKNTRRSPDVLEFEWAVLSDDKDWEAALTCAEEIVTLAPERPFGWIHRSFCLHELGRDEEALESLLPAAESFPNDFLVFYNLACYACSLGDENVARVWLKRAAQLGGIEKLKTMALDDTDLLPLWEEIQGL